MQSLLKKFIASTAATSVALLPVSSRSNPLGEQVTAGSAAIQGQGTSSVIVNQSSNRAIIDWRTFNIAPNETTQFVQPNNSSVTLNRVTGGMGASQIYGTINANGGVFIVNPEGVLFGPSAKVNVGSFLATTHDTANSDFMAGNYNFSISGNPSASIVNQGTITAAKGGFAALVAPGVRNDGVITARLGTVALASANAFTLDLYGDNLIKLQPTDAIAAQVLDVATGKPLISLVQNTGKLKANGGKVLLTAVSAKQVLDSVINSSGVIEANTVGTKNGLVIFGAATADSKVAGAPTQTVKVSGKISAAGKKAGTTGGKIQITGENIVLASAKLNASGQAGGGKILVGGDFKGGSPNAPAVTQYGQSFESAPVPNASNVSVDAASSLNASAIHSGNGGKVVVWSNNTTTFAGSILATGGATGGNGGFVETSGKSLNIDGASAITSAPKGSAGHWLLDPDDFTVDASNAGNINAALANGDVILATSATSTGGNGDIFINAPISWSANTLLTLDAYRSIQVNSNISLTGNLAGLLLDYNDGGISGSFSTATGASVTLTGSAPILAINGTNYNLIRTASDLQALQSGYYALANDIDLSSITNFISIGHSSNLSDSTVIPFEGVLDGLGHTIANLNISSESESFVGLFASIGPLVGPSNLNTVVRNLQIVGANVSVVNNEIYGTYGNFGIIAGQNNGLIFNSSSSGSIAATCNCGTLSIGGGLVGANLGTILASSSAGVLNAGPNVGEVGGLAGYNGGNVISSFSSMTVYSGGGQLYSTGAIGGLVGYNIGNISYSFATGAVSVSDGSSNFYGNQAIGGLTGENSGFISSSYETGNVVAGIDSIGVGGLVGLNGDTTKVISSFATGNVTVSGESLAVIQYFGPAGGVGKLFGSSVNTGPLSSFATGTVNVGANVSGFGGLIGGVTPSPLMVSSISDVVSNWDFTNTWYQPSTGYPLLRAFRTASTSQLLPTSGNGSGTNSGGTNSGSSSSSNGGASSSSGGGSSVLNQQITVFGSAQKYLVSDGTVESVLASSGYDPSNLYDALPSYYSNTTLDFTTESAMPSSFGSNVAHETAKELSEKYGPEAIEKNAEKADLRNLKIGAKLLAKVIPVYNIGVTLSNTKLALPLRLAIASAEVALTSIDFALVRYAKSKGVRVAIAVNELAFILIGSAEKAAEEKE